MCIIVLCEKVLWQEFLAYYQLNWRNFGIWQIQRFHRFKDATTWVKLWWWPWLQEVMELQTWREAWWPWHQEVIMELQRQREAGLQLYIRLIQVIWIMPSFAHLRSMVLSYLSYWSCLGAMQRHKARLGAELRLMQNWILLLDISKILHPSAACLALQNSVLISLSITCCHKVFNLSTETVQHMPALQVSVFII